MTKAMKSLVLLFGCMSIACTFMGVIGPNMFGHTPVIDNLLYSGIAGMGITSIILIIWAIQSACQAHRQAEAADRVAVTISAMIENVDFFKAIICPPLVLSVLPNTEQTMPLQAPSVEVDLIDPHAAQEAPLIERTEEAIGSVQLSKNRS